MELISGDKNNLIFGKYKLTKIIGSGSFGYVYEGININDKKAVAVKVEKKDKGLNLLEKESFYLYNLKGIGLPEVISFGYSGKYNVLVQTLLGESLGKIFFKNNNYFSIKDICMFSIQILHRIEYVHSKYIIHRDIKPENFLIGEPDKYLIYIIDFGLSKKYKSSRTNKHVQFRLTKKFTGTARYASLNAVRGAEQSRRDDLEAIGYMLLFFFNNGKLPWQGVSCKAKAEKYVKIYTMKKNLNYEEFCRNMPKEMIAYMDYCRKLEFEEKPNYDYLRSLFENVLKSKGMSNDLHFSWIKDVSILKSYFNIKNRFNQLNISKRKESPQSRIFRKLESSRETNKEKESEDIKSLKTNNSLQNMPNIVLFKNQAQKPQFIIHKRFNSSGENILLRSKDKDSENIKSGIAQYNISIGDEDPLTEKTFSKKKGDINIIKEILSQNRDISNKNQNIIKNNLYYFSNVNDLCKSLVLKKLNNNQINDFGIDKNNNNNDNEIKKQNSSFFHNRVFSCNSIMKIPNNNNISPNIIKSFSFIKKTKPKIEETKDIPKDIPKEFYTNQKIQKSQIIQSNQNSQNISFNKNNNNGGIKKNVININLKNKYNILKFKGNSKNNIKKYNTHMNKSKNNNNNIIIKNKTNSNIGNQNTQKKVKKIDNNNNNIGKKCIKRKIIKIKVKNIPNIQTSSNNLNCRSAANILKKNTSPNNHQHNLKYSFIQNISNKHLKRDSLKKSDNFSGNFNINNVNNIEGKINKIKSMNVHSNVKKNENQNNNNNNKITTQVLFKNNKNNIIIKTNNNYDILNLNQSRINKYKNIRHKNAKKIGNFPIQKSMTNMGRITETSMHKGRMTNGTVNSTINNCNTVNNTINSNNNNNTIISIYNNYNIGKNNNRYGFIHKKIDSINIALDTLNNINKEKLKNNYNSYNGYKVKINNYKNYIHLNPRKNSTLLNMPSINQLSNYTTLNSKQNNDSNNYNSQVISNKDYSCQELQENFPNKKIVNYFSLKNQNKNNNKYKQNKMMNLSSSRPNLNSYRIKKIFNEFGKNEPKIKRIERNKTQNFMYVNGNGNYLSNNENDKMYNHSYNIMRSNSFLYGSSNFNFDFKKNQMNNFDLNRPSINRKNTEIFYQGLPSFKMNYNIYDSNLINFNKINKPVNKNRAQTRDYYNYKSNREKNNIEIY